MKSIVKAVVAATIIAAPVFSFAQSNSQAGVQLNNQPLTRAQVRADFERVVKAGYDPLDWIHYPENIQAAEARISAEDAGRDAAMAANGAGSTSSGDIGGMQAGAASGHATDAATTAN
jgi:hypothetical protein